MRKQRKQKHEGEAHRTGKIFSRKNLKRIGAAAVLFGLLGGGWMLAGNSVLERITGNQSVEFRQLEETEVPQAIVKDVIPEYRELERALGCLADGKVYVVVTRGEKPTAGFDLTIEEMKLEKTDSGKNLVVTARFIEPPEGEAVAQVITYPYRVAETPLMELPDTIELRTRFE